LMIHVQSFGTRFQRSFGDEVHHGCGTGNAAWTAGDEIHDFAVGIVEAEFGPTPFKAGISFIPLDFLHEMSDLSALLLCHVELGVDDVPASALEVLDAFLDELTIGGLAGNDDAGPGGWICWGERLAETDGVLVVCC
jgi:hypothetical protein